MLKYIYIYMYVCMYVYSFLNTCTYIGVMLNKFKLKDRITPHDSASRVSHKPMQKKVVMKSSDGRCVRCV